MQGVDFDDMTDKERDLVVRFLRLLRSENQSAREEFFEGWDEWKRTAPDLPDAEVERLVNEAVQFARSR